MSVAIHSSVHTIDAFVTLTPLGLSVIAHVRAVTLSPLSAMPVPANPSITCPMTAKMAPIYSDRFWNDESTPNPKKDRSTALTPFTTSVPSARIDHITPAPLREESNSATRIGVAGANDSIVLVNSVSRKRTRHSIALQHWIAMIASAEK